MMKYRELHTLRLLMEGASVIDVARLRDTARGLSHCIPMSYGLSWLYPTLSRYFASYLLRGCMSTRALQAGICLG